MTVEDINAEAARLSEVKRCRALMFVYAASASSKPVFCSYVEISLCKSSGIYKQKKKKKRKEQRHVCRPHTHTDTHTLLAALLVGAIFGRKMVQNMTKR